MKYQSRAHPSLPRDCMRSTSALLSTAIYIQLSIIIHSVLIVQGQHHFVLACTDHVIFWLSTSPLYRFWSPSIFVFECSFSAFMQNSDPWPWVIFAIFGLFLFPFWDICFDFAALVTYARLKYLSWNKRCLNPSKNRYTVPCYDSIACLSRAKTQMTGNAQEGQNGQKDLLKQTITWIPWIKQKCSVRCSVRSST